jgi:hypothetical protein
MILYASRGIIASLEDVPVNSYDSPRNSVILIIVQEHNASKKGGR